MCQRSGAQAELLRRSARCARRAGGAPAIARNRPGSSLRGHSGACDVSRAPRWQPSRHAPRDASAAAPHLPRPAPRRCLPSQRRGQRLRRAPPGAPAVEAPRRCQRFRRLRRHRRLHHLRRCPCVRGRLGGGRAWEARCSRGHGAGATCGAFAPSICRGGRSVLFGVAAKSGRSRWRARCGGGGGGARRGGGGGGGDGGDSAGRWRPS